MRSGRPSQLSANKVSPLISGVVNKWTMCFPSKTKLKVMGRKGRNERRREREKGA